MTPAGRYDAVIVGGGPNGLPAAAYLGVATRHPRILLCGSGARRGGGVSGIGGQNAAMAVLAEES